MWFLQYVLSIFYILSYFSVCERIGPGVMGEVSNPPSKSRRSPPTVLPVLVDRLGPVLPTAVVGCKISSEPPSKSSRLQTCRKVQSKSVDLS